MPGLCQMRVAICRRSARVSAALITKSIALAWVRLSASHMRARYPDTSVQEGTYTTSRPLSSMYMREPKAAKGCCSKL